MKHSRRMAFTLIEVLIGVLMMSIVVSGVAFTIKSGLSLYEKADANALVVNGARWTVDSFNREIAPLLDVATEIEVLDMTPQQIGNLPPNNLSDDVYYVFLRDRAVTYADKSKTVALPGSEYIDSIDFSVPASSGDETINYILSIDVHAKNPDYETAKIDLGIKKALFNKPEKADTSNKEGNNYVGNVLRFKSIAMTVSFDVVLENLHLLSGDVVVDNRVDVIKGASLHVSYDVHPSEPPGYTLEDDSTYEWYISGSNPSTENISTANLTTSNRENYYWLLVDTHGEPITTPTLSTTDLFHVRTGASGYSAWGNYGVIRCKVSPALKRPENDSRFEGQAKFSPLVGIIKKPISSLGPGLWNRWTAGLLSGEDPQFFAVNTEDVNIHLDTQDGEVYATIIMPTGGSTGSATVATALSDLLNEARNFVEESDGRSYTTITNYSIIVDAEVNAGDGYGLLLSGASMGHTAETFADCGYMLQYDKTLDAIPIRLYSAGYHASDYHTAPFGMSFESLTNNDYFTGYAETDWGGPFYGPGYMKNNIFSFNSSGSGSNKKPWNERRRVMITVLEYYDKDEGVAHPRFLMRVRLLKNYNEVSQSALQNGKDPWFIGPDFFYSEPVWYGGFVGDVQQTVYQTRRNWFSDWIDVTEEEYDRKRPVTNRQIVYRYTVKNYSGFNGNKIESQSQSNEPTVADRYITRMNKRQNDGQINAIFRAKRLDVRTNINDYNYLEVQAPTTQIDVRTAGNTAFSDPQRIRYTGLRIWGANSAASKFYSVNYAPGFRKVELQAIMPQGAKMYELADTGDVAPENLIQTGLNTELFGPSGFSGGSGSGVMSLQHVGANGEECSCPLCTFYD